MPVPVRGRDEALMRLALDEARACAATSDVPVGAVVVSRAGVVLGRGRNRREEHSDPSSHAELEALRAAGAALGSWRLPDATLVVTLEPCLMCAGAIVQARVSRVVFGARDEKAGAFGSVYDVPRDRRTAYDGDIVGGILEDECGELLRRFFAGRR